MLSEIHCLQSLVLIGLSSLSQYVLAQLSYQQTFASKFSFSVNQMYLRIIQSSPMEPFQISVFPMLHCTFYEFYSFFK